jgi:hypothetical protein
MGRVAALIGNGLTISFGEWSGLSDRWDTQRPLDWPVMTPGKPKVSLLDSLPEFRDTVEHVRSMNAGLSDFEVFDEVTRITGVRPMDFDKALIQTQLRHFLGLAYSTYQLDADQVALGGWHWADYLMSIAGDFVGAMSFNYDLMFERLLEHAGLSVRGLGIQGENPGEGVWVGKPHGSVDYEMAEGNIHIGPGVTYPLTMAILLNDAPIRRLAPAELLQPRLQIELVPPLGSSMISSFQGVADSFARFAAIGPVLDTLLVVGLSYWPCDQQEINFLLDQLAPSTRVVVANPHPPEPFLGALKARGLKWEHWPEGPPT